MATVANATGRAAAILTTGEVFGTALDMANTVDGRVTVDLTFTIGSLTNVIVKFYGSADDITYDPLANGIAQLTETLTASAERMYVISAPGVRYFKASVQGTGTVTSSTCAYVYRYQPYLTTSNLDVASRIT
jgi:hypothetical protein